MFLYVSFEFTFLVKYYVVIYFAVSLGVFCLVANVEGKKIPGFVKKLNKFLGLPPKSKKVMDILSISGNTAKINENAGSIDANAGSINDNTGSINDNAGTIEEITGNIAKNTADIARYHPSKLQKKHLPDIAQCS